MSLPRNVLFILALLLSPTAFTLDGCGAASEPAAGQTPSLEKRGETSSPAAAQPSQRKLTGLEDRVRHELVMLPYYSVFDNLGFRVNGYRVELYGQVTRPTLKSSAEAAVRKIEGIEGVDNHIEVLPLSPNDDRIRRGVYRAIFGYPSLQRYGMGSNPSIHIIVNRGHVTLEGVVSSENDKNVAYIRANGVSGVFSVTNNLRVGD